MKPLISVIVPVYNVEKYLDGCLESIVNQTYRNLEIILVDDGSPDHCPQMCDNWAKKDHRIVVLHLSNGGAGKARNEGMKLCRGDYISFVDSDDLLSERFYETLIRHFDDNIDIVECEFISFEEHFDTFPTGKDDVIVCTAQEALSYHLSDKLFRQVIWNKLYKKKILIDLFFPEGNLIDDEFWTYQVIGRSNQLVHVQQYLYAYRQQPDSVMHRKYSIERLQALEAKENRLKFIELYYPELYTKAKIELYGACIFAYQAVLRYMTGEDKRIATTVIKQYRHIYSLSFSELKAVKGSQKKYYYLAKISFYLCCKLRAVLGIGF